MWSSFSGYTILKNCRSTQMSYSFQNPIYVVITILKLYMSSSMIFVVSPLLAWCLPLVRCKETSSFKQDVQQFVHISLWHKPWLHADLGVWYLIALQVWPHNNSIWIWRAFFRRHTLCSLEVRELYESFKKHIVLVNEYHLVSIHYLYNVKNCVETWIL